MFAWTSLPRRGALGLALRLAPPPKPPPKKLSKDVRESRSRPGRGCRTAGAAAKVGVHPRVAELVVPGPLLLVGEHLVGLVDLFELGLGVLVPGVQVRVVLSWPAAGRPF